MLRVLCTGGAGYVGSRLTEKLLKQGWKVTVLDNLMYGSEHNLFHLFQYKDFEFFKGDVQDNSLVDGLLKRVDVVIPLAAIVGAPACITYPIESERVNTTAVAHLAYKTSKDQLIVYPTTNSGYGTKSGDVYCTEETPLEPISLYGKQKCLAEKFLLENHENTISLRLATVFGMSSRMRLDLLVNDFVRTAMTDGYIVLFEKDFKRNYVYIGDVADCFVHCVENREKMVGKSYNLGLDSANLSKYELASKIKDHLPSFCIHTADIGKDPDQRNYIVSNERLRDAGFEAKTSLDDGISELIRGYLMFGRNRFTNN